MDAPRAFWKYYDLFRRKKITFGEFMRLSGIQSEQMQKYLKELRLEEKRNEKWDGRWYNSQNM